MKALILNSGIGSRMGEETKLHPKCMTLLTENETILSRQLSQLAYCGVKEIVLTTGYCSDILMEYCDNIDKNLHISYIKNERYDSTNYIYSIYQARLCVKEDILLLHGDLVFDNSVLEDILQCEDSCMVVDSTLELPDKDFKAVVTGERISEIGIQYFRQAVTAQPLYKLLWKDWKVWLFEIERFCKKNKVNCYAENAFNKVSDQCKIVPLDIKGRLCREIDTVEDREKVLKMIT